MSWKDNFNITIIAVLFFVAKLLTLGFYKIVWWDSAVYIGMGKYIYSFGAAGLWEPLRPVMWPLILGVLWKADMNVILAGRILEIAIGSLCILLTYFIGKRVFNEKTGLLAAVFLALSSQGRRRVMHSMSHPRPPFAEAGNGKKSVGVFARCPFACNVARATLYGLAEGAGVEPARPEGLAALAVRCLSARPTLRIRNR